jgi:hypothetical protein
MAWDETWEAEKFPPAAFRVGRAGWDKLRLVKAVFPEPTAFGWLKW